MRVMHRAADCHEQLARGSWPHRLASNRLVQSAALHQLHAVKAESMALADLKNRNNGGMIQSRRGFSFQAKALEPFAAREMARRNTLERHHPIQPFLSRAINDSLAASTDFREQFVLAEFNGRALVRREFRTQRALHQTA